SEAIARNLLEMAKLKVPVVCTVTGEAGSGGALAIGVGNRVLMLQYGIYSVISPEGCASILWKDAAKASEAARAMGITADKILESGLVDRVIPEPLGGAHRNVPDMTARLKEILIDELRSLKSLSVEELLNQRYDKFMAMGAC
ncbi:acetyl-CoA carboxylase carboxyl transferase subunit alpha, partial [Legionella sp. 29fVS95]